ncbi:hypothetical protein PENSUB_6236 [Penicillium subrubescens]|uniref:Uncharacterized protein n=1 Tax=Penicillium subrubescens TaxID=1316194 RepID=A0A1Q5U190_9EURO|nr:hypothetical protein PENSUB_6236 [Penicillium subrubescens]
MANTIKIPEKIQESAPNPNPGVRLREFLLQDPKAPAGLSNSLSVTLHGDLAERTEFYKMLEEVARVDSSYQKIKQSSTSMALVGLGLDVGGRRAIRCLLRLPKSKLRILGQALGEPSNDAILNYLDYESMCETKFKHLSADEQTEMVRDIRACTSANVQDSSRITAPTTWVSTTAQNSSSNYGKTGLPKASGAKVQVATPSIAATIQPSVSEH